MDQNKNNKRFLKCFFAGMVILIFLGLNIFLLFSISISGSLYKGYSEYGSSAPNGRYLGYGFLGSPLREYTGFPYDRNPGYGLFVTPYIGYSGQIPFGGYCGS